MITVEHFETDCNASITTTTIIIIIIITIIIVVVETSAARATVAKCHVMPS